MDKKHLTQQIFQKKSFLCIGLDSDTQKIPLCLSHHKDPVFAFNKQIADDTHDLVVAYKLNTAFYEAQGAKGWKSLNRTTIYIKKKYPDIFLIADAKRGDIGNTSVMYAKAFFEEMPFDAITLSPYMGEDVVKPFLQYNNKWVILLALTSNQSAHDFQFLQSPEFLFKQVIKTANRWAGDDRIMYVVGATKAEMIEDIRKIVPSHFLLVPGVGVQGGNLEVVINVGKNNDGGLLINSSRGIIFADNSENFSVVARQQALALQKTMEVNFLFT